MKKTFSKILMLVILVGIFMLPLSGGLKNENDKLVVKVEISKVSAQTDEEKALENNWTFGSGKFPDSYVTNGPFTKAGCDAAVAQYKIDHPGIKTYDCKYALNDNYKKAATTNTIPVEEQDAFFGCTISPLTWFTNCIVKAIYTLIFQPIAAVTRLTARFLDYFIYYSISDASYRSDFIKDAWGTVRDITNIFFIIALLYVAIKTILSLNVSDNKRLVGTIIIVALLINFSLFTTKVIIDASNILAHVFYNSIVPYDQNGNLNPAGGGGEKSITVGLIRQIDPVAIINTPANDLGLFTFVLLISIAMMLYIIYMFLSVAIMFVARVVGLWLAMIFSPFAFISYTLPFSIPEFGHKDWWPSLFKAAFLAPVFIFFLYIIILFEKSLKLIYNGVTTDATWIDKAMHVIIPFAIIFILLMNAKKIATDFSGKIGAAVAKVGALAGGLALAAASGGTSMALRTTVGRAGAALANNSRLKAWAARSKFGSGIQTLAKKAGSGSMDIRGIKVAGKSLSDTGLTGLGKAKEGGFTKAREERVQRRQKRAEELKVGEDEHLNQEVRRSEVAVAEAKAAAAPRLLELNEGELDAHGRPIAGIAGQGLGQLEREATRTERALADAERGLKDAVAQFGATSHEADAARGRQATAVGERDTARNNVNTRQADIRGAGHDTHNAEISLKRANNAKIAEDRTRLNNFADRNNSRLNNIFTVLGGGAWKGNREASYKIRAEAKQENTSATSGGHH